MKLDWKFLLLVLIFILNFLIFSNTPLLESVEKLDADKVFYTEQMQKLLNNEETELRFPTYRVLSPWLSIWVSNLSGLSYEDSMIFLSMLFGIITLYFLHYYFYDILLSMYGGYHEIEPKRKLLTSLYVFSPVIIQFSTTYFVDILAILLGLLTIYFLHKGRYLAMIITFVLGVANKETALCYPIVWIAYLIFIKRDELTEDFVVILLAWFVGFVYYRLQYVYWFSTKSDLITNMPATMSLLDNVMLHFTDFWGQLGSFLIKGIPLLIMSFVFAYGLFILLLIPAYKKIWERDKVSIIISHILMLGVLLIWSLQTIAPKFVFYLTSPIFIVLIVQYAYEYYEDKLSKVVIAGYVVSVILLVLYIFMHNITWFYSLLGIGG